MTRLDTNLAWREASSAIAANREVMLALAGVFFLLPRLLFEFLTPLPPTQGPGATMAQLSAAMQAYWVQALPYFAPLMVIEAAGTLALLTLFTDRSRPTVGEAIREGFLDVVPYLAACLLFTLGFSLVGGMLLSLGFLTGVPLLGGIVIGLVGFGFAFSGARLLLLGPVVAVERLRNPIAALRRSWRLTAGNALRLCVMMMLLILVLSVLTLALSGIGGAAAGALGGGPEAGDHVRGAVSAVVSSIFAIYFAGMLAAVHRQLAGPSAEAIGRTFE